MWKKFMPRLVALKRERSNRAKRAALFAQLGLEALEARLTPAPAPVFRGPLLTPVEWAAPAQVMKYLGRCRLREGESAYSNIQGLVQSPPETSIVLLG